MRYSSRVAVSAGIRETPPTGDLQDTRAVLAPVCSTTCIFASSALPSPTRPNATRLMTSHRCRGVIVAHVPHLWVTQALEAPGGCYRRKSRRHEPRERSHSEQ